MKWHTLTCLYFKVIKFWNDMHWTAFKFQSYLSFEMTYIGLPLNFKFFKFDTLNILNWVLLKSDYIVYNILNFQNKKVTNLNEVHSRSIIIPKLAKRILRICYEYFSHSFILCHTVYIFLSLLRPIPNTDIEVNL